MTDTQAPSLLTIDLGAVAANYRTLQQAAGKTPVAGVVKANGYGLGAEQIGRTLKAQGCREFFVANVAEGVTLRAALGADATIFIIGGILSGDTDAFTDHNLIPVLNGLRDIEAWRGNTRPCAVHFDTGMNRLGLNDDETAHVLENPALLDNLNIVLGMSHFASSEDLDDKLNDIQIKRFRNITARSSIKRWSLCNTSAIFLFKDDHYDLVRGGYGLYGGNPLPHLANPMRAAVHLKARVLQVKTAKGGESVGYNATHTLKGDDELAVVALGYADGYLRSQSDRGFVYWQGQPCPITGRVSMDLTTVRIGHLKGQKPQAGDWLEVLGPSQPVDALAGNAGTNGYEILTRLGGRYARVYIDAL